jgi:hypothetical protein
MMLYSKAEELAREAMQPSGGPNPPPKTAEAA